MIRVLVAAGLVAGVLAWPGAARPAQAAPLPCIVSPLACIAGGAAGAASSVFCPSSKSSQIPAVRFSGDTSSISSNFDGFPVVLDNLPAGSAPPPASIYRDRGVHPLSFTQFDEGCGGPVLDPGDTLDTTIGNWEFGVAIDLTAMANGTHKYATHPDLWMAPIERLETHMVATTSAKLWSLFLVLSGLVLAVVIVSLANKGNLAAVTSRAGWALAVFALVVVVIADPLHVTRSVGHAETQSINIVDSTVSDTSGPATAGDLSMNAVLYPAWVKAEFGPADQTLIDKYAGPLLDATSMTWAQAAQPDRRAVIDAKHKAFMQIASDIHAADPDAYAALKGQNGGRIGIGFYALAATAVTVPLRILADLLAMGALLVLAVTAIFIPILGLIGLHEPFKPMFRAVVDNAIIAGVVAIAATVAAAILLEATEFLLGPNSGIPNWVGLTISAILMFYMTFKLRHVRRYTAAAAGVPVGVRGGARRVVRAVTPAPIAAAVSGGGHHYSSGSTSPGRTWESGQHAPAPPVSASSNGNGRTTP